MSLRENDQGRRDIGYSDKNERASYRSSDVDSQCVLGVIDCYGQDHVTNAQNNSQRPYAVEKTPLSI
jgi:hypothetical protein